MNWQMITAIGEIIGAIGVIVSILYLAMQVRQATRATQRVNAQRIGDGVRQWWAQLSGDDELSSIWRRGLTDFRSLSANEAVRFSCLMCGLMNIQEELYYVHVDRAVDPWIGQLMKSGLREIACLPGFQDWYKERGGWITAEFRSAIDRQAVEGSAVPPASWYRHPDSASAA